jgi:hypothetical protein
MKRKRDIGDRLGLGIDLEIIEAFRALPAAKKPEAIAFLRKLAFVKGLAAKRNKAP